MSKVSALQVVQRRPEGGRSWVPQCGEERQTSRGDGPSPRKGTGAQMRCSGLAKNGGVKGGPGAHGGRSPCVVKPQTPLTNLEGELLHADWVRAPTWSLKLL